MQSTLNLNQTHAFVDYSKHLKEMIPRTIASLLGTI